jgi:hypothetical protein
VAHWAYKEVREYWSPDYKSKWQNAVVSHTEALNAQFIEPLPYSEVKSISKSIANFVIRHFSPEKFRESQAIKGRKGGKISRGGGRPKSYDASLLESIASKKAKGLSNRGIAEDLNISPSTVSKYLKLSLE